MFHTIGLLRSVSRHFQGPQDSLREMIKKVDDLMFRVKKTGKNNIIHIECIQEHIPGRDWKTVS